MRIESSKRSQVRRYESDPWMEQEETGSAPSMLLMNAPRKVEWGGNRISNQLFIYKGKFQKAGIHLSFL